MTLPPRYTPAEHEPRIWQRWTSHPTRPFHADPSRVDRAAPPNHAPGAKRPPYGIIIPPPNVTGRLHLGHALNNTLQDILIRAHRMMGFETLWMPGTDHAGIATQAVVEKRLLKEENKRKSDFTRDEFIARVQQWKDEYEAAITDQLKRMGCSCDFDRQRFTMDDICARAVREAFFRLFRDGLIYRGKRLVNWDPELQTAVADDETESIDIDGFFYYLRYPLTEKATLPSGETIDHVTVATTRPETYLGDTAVALNPKDPRAAALVGKKVRLPLINREIPIIADDYVVMPLQGGPALGGPALGGPALRAGSSASSGFTLYPAGAVNPLGAVEPTKSDPRSGSSPLSPPEPEDPKAKFATGFLKVTPAHDPNDYDIGQRHSLPQINIMSPDGRISDQHGLSDIRGAAAEIFLGLKLSTKESHQKVIAEFKKLGLFEKQVTYQHAVAHSQRSGAAIEPYLSDQWYCKVTDPRMAPAANAVLRGGMVLGGPALRAGSPTPQSSTDSGSIGTANSLLIDAANFPPLSPPGFVPRDPFPKGEPSPRDLREHTRNLPHLELHGATYFVTWRAQHGEVFTDAERRMVMDALRYWDGKSVKLYAAVVMPDHAHALVKPTDEQSVSDWASSVKRFSAREINRSRESSGPVWQDEHYDHIIRDSAYFTEQFRYIVRNPVEAGLVPQPSAYPHTHVQAEVVEEILKRLSAPTRHGEADHQESATALRADPARSAGPPQDTLTFHPARYAKTYESWHTNIRDWCISRQLWWGHRIPVWRGETNIIGIQGVRQTKLKNITEWKEQLKSWINQGRIAINLGGTSVFDFESDIAWIAEQDSKYIYVCVRDSNDSEIIEFLEKSTLIQDPDVLDTWFSSALWPSSTMGWPDPAAAAAIEPKNPDFAALLAAFNPSSVLCTAREIITLWVSRMVMFNRYLMPEGWPAPCSSSPSSGGPALRAGSSHPSSSSPSTRHGVPGHAEPSHLDHSARGSGPVPFTDVFIHSVIQDGEGRKMSKSLGNGVDPLDIIDSHGADAMRFVLCHMTTQTQDVRLPVEKDPTSGKNTSPKFDLGRNFCTKLWNASRFAMMNLDGGSALGGPALRAESPLPQGGPALRAEPPLPQGGPALRAGSSTELQSDSARSAGPTQSLPLIDRWMLSRVARTINATNEALADYQFSVYAQSLYDLMWRDFCDWYLEAIKPTVKSSPAQQAVLRATLDSILRLLHPVMPFVTETIHESLREFPGGGGEIDGLALPPAELLVSAPWPIASPALIDESAERDFAFIQELTDAVRTARSAKGVEQKRKITLHADAALLARLAAAPGTVELLAGLERITADAPPADRALFTFQAREYALSNLADALDPAAERASLEIQVTKLDKEIAALSGRLNNPGYAQKAPPKLVEESKAQLAQKEAERDAAARRLQELA